MESVPDDREAAMVSGRRTRCARIRRPRIQEAGAMGSGNRHHRVASAGATHVTAAVRLRICAKL